jgi:hypothetical protein
MLKQFERLASRGPIDLGEWLQMYGTHSLLPVPGLIGAFDVVGELAFGRKFGFLEEGIFTRSPRV